MPDRIRLGMLTPSSNTVLEPVSAALVADLPEVSVHFGRFRVVEISLRDAALGQFDMAPMLGAAELLADAKVDAICWNGTSAGWMGLYVGGSVAGRTVQTGCDRAFRPGIALHVRRAGTHRRDDGQGRLRLYR